MSKNKPNKEKKKVELKEKFKNFFKEKAPHLLDVIGDFLPDEGGLGILKKIIDKDTIVSPEARVDFDDLYRNSLEELKLINEDISDARNREIKINSSDNSSWLVKNIVPILAITWTTFGMVIFILVLIGKLNIDRAIIMLVINSVSNIVFMIIGYYFGSSQGSKDKQKQLIKNI